MKYFVYILKSELHNSNYVGISKDPYKRLKEHNTGMSKYTKGRRPYKLIHIEVCSDRISARKKEKYYKSGFGRKQVQSFIPL